MNVVAGDGVVGDVGAAVVNEMLRRGLMLPPGTMMVPVEATTAPDPFDTFLEAQIDRLRDAARLGDPAEFLGRFQEFLEALPENASGKVRFRVKANIGLRHLALGDAANASRWLIEAYDEAPDDPRAVANKALGLWIGGDARAAYEFGLQRLAEDPGNEALASYLPQIAVIVDEVDHPMRGIPDALLDREALVVARVVFLRGRNLTPAWWEEARDSAGRFPGSADLSVLKAFADLDEITRDGELQRTHVLRDDFAVRLNGAAAVLDAYWRQKSSALRSPFDDASHALTGAMVCYQLLRCTDAAVERAERIADEGLEEPQVLVNAVQVAISAGRQDLARRLVALAPDDRDLAFQAGIVAVQEGHWDAAAEAFSRADVPPEERTVADVICALARLRAGGEDAPALDEVHALAQGSSRALVLLSRLAAEIGEEELSERAFREAADGIADGSHISARLMVAALAGEIGKPTDVIKLLDGHLPSTGYDRERAWLAVAHANERPRRRRNLAFFDGLAAALRARPEIARAHASVLLDMGRVPDALRILRRVHQQSPDDAFVVLLMLECLRRDDDRRGARRVLRALDLTRLRGDPAYLMAVVAAVADHGEVARAYAAAYDLIRRHGERPEVALAYVGIGLMRRGRNPSFRQTVAGPGAYVQVEGPGGASRGFVIDDGGDFFGIQVEAPAGGMARLVSGMRRGETFTLPKMGAEPESWRVALVQSKYLHLHHRIMEDFELRYPGQPGLARFTIGEGDISEILAMVRRTAEANRETAQLYIQGHRPLVAVARLLGGDPVSFAQYVRALGGRVATCLGTGDEREAGMALAAAARGRGAVLDPYTAWVAAEMDLLPALRLFFGTLVTPLSTLTMIDRIIERERQGLGHRQMTLAYVDGEFIRQEIDDDFRRSQIAVLEAGRGKIVASCEVEPALLPDDLPDVTLALLDKVGSRFLDAAFIAKERGMPLLSDDMHYRAWAGATVGCSGFWLQAALMAAVEQATLAMPEYARAVLGLARRRHGHVSLNAVVLHEICAADDADLGGMKSLLAYLGGKEADMPSHLATVWDFLEMAWRLDSTLSPLRRRAATGAVLDALLRGRKDDWRFWLAQAIRQAPRSPVTRAYIKDWLDGHFIHVQELVGQSPSLPRLRSPAEEA